jgi:simple sugar transport system ATP-binding protein
MDQATVPLLETRLLTKRFGDLLAVDHVDLGLHAGEIHTLLGENGAGKSTVMKMIYGVYHPDGGQILAAGTPVDLTTPAAARHHGIGMVFQNFRLIPALTVWENIALALPDLGLTFSQAQIKNKIRETAEKYDLAVDPDVAVWRLDVGQRQRVEIVKVLLIGARILLFDEPTSVLAVTEVGAFLAMLRRLRDEGYAILFVTHKIQEVLQCADRVTVMRRGQIVYTTTDVAAEDEQSLVTHMVGKWDAPILADRSSVRVHEPLLKVANLQLKDDHGLTILDKVNFEIAAGEIVGVAGISGNGQRELADALCGLRPLAAGSIVLDGINLSRATPAQFLRAGIVSIPENPLEESIVPGLTVLEHMVLGGLTERRRGLGLDWPQVRAEFDGLAEVKSLQVAAADRKADQLSGGNVQRMMLSRALAQKPKLLIASYPSRGLDIATIRSVHRSLVERSRMGAAILIFSEDLNELYTLAHRLLVLSHGEMSRSIDPNVTDAYAVAERMVVRSH